MCFLEVLYKGYWSLIEVEKEQFKLIKRWEAFGQIDDRIGLKHWRSVSQKIS